MERRIVYLEESLRKCLKELGTVSSQVTKMQVFLENQFGTRCLETVLKKGSSKGNFQVKLEIAEEEEEEGNWYGEQDPSNPLAFVEIVDDTEEEDFLETYLDNGEEEDAEGELTFDTECGKEQEEYYAEEQQEQEQQDSEQQEDFNGTVEVNYGRSTSNLITNSNNSKSATASNFSNNSYQNQGIRKRPAKNRFLGQPYNKKPTLEGGATVKQEAPELDLEVPYVVEQMENGAQDDDSLPPVIKGLLEADDNGYDDSNSMQMLQSEADVPLNGENLSQYYDILPDKSVKCRLCQKVLKAGWHKYPRHYRTHTGEKPFACEYCGERFARKDNMHNHVKSKHLQIKRDQMTGSGGRRGNNCNTVAMSSGMDPSYTSAYLPPDSIDLFLD